jgi:hypothetical protein
VDNSDIPCLPARVCIERCWVCVWTALVVPFHTEGFRAPTATEIQAEKVIVAYPILFQVSTSQQSLKMTLDEIVSDIMSFPWIGLLIVVACLTVGVIGSYLGLRWWYRSILKDLEHRQQQKSKQKK